MENTKTQNLKLGMTIPLTIRTYIDASFAVHSDYKSHTGICISLGVGVYFAKSTAQKINTTSSCQAEMDRGLITVVYCPTENMIADFFTKPLQGTLFNHMREKVTGISPVCHIIKF